MVHEPLLIGQLHLIFASPYDIIIALSSEHCRLFSLHTSVHVNIRMRIYTSLHIDSAAPILTMTLQLQKPPLYASHAVITV